MKARQSTKLTEIKEALGTAGIHTLDEQAKALGLNRITTWTILRDNHKNSGLSAATINRILAVPQMPPLVRAKILEYVEEKKALERMATPQRYDERLSLPTQQNGTGKPRRQLTAKSALR